MFAARGLAQGIGPLIFSSMFLYYTRPEHYLPGAPLIVAAVGMGFGFLVALSLDIPPTERKSCDIDLPLQSATSLFGNADLELGSSKEEQGLLGGHEMSDLSPRASPKSASGPPIKSFALTVQAKNGLSKP